MNIIEKISADKLDIDVNVGDHVNLIEYIDLQNGLKHPSLYNFLHDELVDYKKESRQIPFRSTRNAVTDAYVKTFLVNSDDFNTIDYINYMYQTINFIILTRINKTLDEDVKTHQDKSIKIVPLQHGEHITLLFKGGTAMNFIYNAVLEHERDLQKREILMGNNISKKFKVSDTDCAVDIMTYNNKRYRRLTYACAKNITYGLYEIAENFELLWNLESNRDYKQDNSYYYNNVGENHRDVTPDSIYPDINQLKYVIDVAKSDEATLGRINNIHELENVLELRANQLENGSKDPFECGLIIEFIDFIQITKKINIFNDLRQTLYNCGLISLRQLFEKIDQIYTTVKKEEFKSNIVAELNTLKANIETKYNNGEIDNKTLYNKSNNSYYIFTDVEINKDNVKFEGKNDFLLRNQDNTYYPYLFVEFKNRLIEKPNYDANHINDAYNEGYRSNLGNESNLGNNNDSHNINHTPNHPIVLETPNTTSVIPTIPASDIREGSNIEDANSNVSEPKNTNKLIPDSSNLHYISVNNSLIFFEGVDSVSNFNLLRIKLNTKLENILEMVNISEHVSTLENPQYANNTNNANKIMAPSEILDITISDKFDVIKGYFKESNMGEYHIFKWNNNKLYSYNNRMHCKDLSLILFNGTYCMPWTNLKYTKRIYRLLFFAGLQVGRNEFVNLLNIIENGINNDITMTHIYTDIKHEILLYPNLCSAEAIKNRHTNLQINKLLDYTDGYQEINYILNSIFIWCELYNDNDINLESILVHSYKKINAIIPDDIVQAFKNKYLEYIGNLKEIARIMRILFG